MPHIRTAAGPSPEFRSRGGQKPGGVKNQKGGPHFSNAVLDVCSNRWAKREMGGTDFKWGDRSPLSPPLVTALDSSYKNALCCQQYSQVCSGNLHNRLTADFPNRALIFKERCMVFDETTNYSFILPNKTCHRHFETAAANVWHLVQNDQRSFE